VATFNTATDAMVGSPIQVGQNASAIAIASDGLRAYVTNYSDNTVSVIDISTQ
jgi:DNA-binding beta-propeller fold protein YncE